MTEPVHQTTDALLLDRLRKAAWRPMNRTERREQRISWLIGQTGLDREIIERMLADRER